LMNPYAPFLEKDNWCCNHSTSIAARRVWLVLVRCVDYWYWHWGWRSDGSPLSAKQLGVCCWRRKVCGGNSLGVVATFVLMQLRPWVFHFSRCAVLSDYLSLV
jgi:hypothetical protein